MGDMRGSGKRDGGERTARQVIVDGGDQGTYIPKKLAGLDVRLLSTNAHRVNLSGDVQDRDGCAICI